MSMSIAQTRQQLSAMIDLAQSTPQVITKHNTPIAVLVSTEYFNRTESAAYRAISFYNELLELRKTYEPQDDLGLPALGPRNLPKSRQAGDTANEGGWSRSNSFVKSPRVAKK